MHAVILKTVLKKREATRQPYLVMPLLVLSLTLNCDDAFQTTTDERGMGDLPETLKYPLDYNFWTTTEFCSSEKPMYKMLLDQLKLEAF
jgi:hypothetical protein